MFTDPVIILLILSLVGFILWREYRHRRELVRILQERDARYEPLLSAAKESQARYRSIFENSLDGIFLTAPDGRILAANPAMCRMLGRSEEEICQIGRDGVVNPSDPQVIAALKERTESGKFRREMHLVRWNHHPAGCDFCANDLRLELFTLGDEFHLRRRLAGAGEFQLRNRLRHQIPWASMFECAGCCATSGWRTGRSRGSISTTRNLANPKLGGLDILLRCAWYRHRPSGQ
jgi:PAS domain S-box-containing protein